MSRLNHYVGGNAVTLLRSGAEYFPAVETAIEAAQHEVHLQTYIYAADDIGLRIGEALKRAAQRGVVVNLLLDGYGSKELAKGRKAGFPKSLHGAPLLLPLENSTLRRSLNQWFARHQVEPHVVAEFEDSALLKEFGANGVGIFAAPSIVESEIVRQYGVVAIGRAEQVRESFYAVSIERRLKHPAVLAITDAARQELFA